MNSSKLPDNFLPVPIDGTTKASFSLSARYKNDASTAPTGSFVFTYGNFKLQSQDLDWLVVPSPREATFQGTAAIRGMDGKFHLWVTVRDGDPDGTDRLAFKVWALEEEPSVSPPLYSASGFAGGQIRVQR